MRRGAGAAYGRRRTGPPVWEAVTSGGRPPAALPAENRSDRLGRVKMVITARDSCAHCGSPIVDATTRVIHGESTYCCTNCSNAMEQRGAGSDPEGRQHPNDLHCAHCDSPIVDESTMETRGDDAFCCRNCLVAMERMDGNLGA